MEEKRGSIDDVSDLVIDNLKHEEVAALKNLCIGRTFLLRRIALSGTHDGIGMALIWKVWPLDLKPCRHGDALLAFEWEARSQKLRVSYDKKPKVASVGKSGSRLLFVLSLAASRELSRSPLINIYPKFEVPGGGFVIRGELTFLFQRRQLIQGSL